MSLNNWMSGVGLLETSKKTRLSHNFRRLAAFGYQKFNPFKFGFKLSKQYSRITYSFLTPAAAALPRIRA
jgi:hypothetical protein